MSVWLAGSAFYGRLYGTLHRIYTSPVDNSEKTLKRHLIQSFPKIDWFKGDPVKDLCTKLWKLNAKAYASRYGERHTIGQAAIKNMLAEADEVDNMQLFKDIGFLEYQTDGDKTSGSHLYKGLVEFEGRIAVQMAINTPEYDNAKWG